MKDTNLDLAVCPLHRELTQARTLTWKWNNTRNTCEARLTLARGIHVEHIGSFAFDFDGRAEIAFMSCIYVMV